jgi:hypothetical protein
VSLGPLELAGLTLHFEVLVALGATEAELSGIVADECDSLTRECRAGTEVTGFNTARKNNPLGSRNVWQEENHRKLTAWLQSGVGYVFVESQETFSKAGPE